MRQFCLNCNIPIIFLDFFSWGFKIIFMKIKRIILILVLLLLNRSLLAMPMSVIQPIPSPIAEKMRHYTWRPGCPVPISDLRYLRLPYWGFDHQAHQGVLIVNAKLAKQVVTIFVALYRHHFPIERMQPMYLFKGNDELAMEHNNTSSFNCRPVAGRTSGFSQHAYGMAIDINTRINPYIKGKVLLPKNAKPYINRKVLQAGMIGKDTYIYRLFMQHGWQWGGNWHSLKDYQHFQKPLPEYKKKG